MKTWTVLCLSLVFFLLACQTTSSAIIVGNSTNESHTTENQKTESQPTVNQKTENKKNDNMKTDIAEDVKKATSVLTDVASEIKLKTESFTAALAANNYHAAVETLNDISLIQEKTPQAKPMIQPLLGELTKKLDTTFQSVSVVIKDNPGETVKNTAFKWLFSVQFLNSETKLPLIGVPVCITYPVSSLNGVCEYTSIRCKTSETGQASFVSPVPNFSCNSTVAFELDLPASVEKFTQEHSNLRTEIPYLVSTDLKTRGGSIALVDFAKNGKPITSNSLSSSALLTELIKKGFRQIGNSDFTAPIVAGNDEAVQKEAVSMFGKTAGYLIYGTVKYEKAETSDNRFVLILKTDIKVRNLIENKMLFATTIYTESADKTEYGALLSARKSLSAELSKLLLYGM